MFQAFVVTAREACELLLVILAVLVWLHRAGRPELTRWVMAAALAGFAAAAAVIGALPPSGMNEWLDIGLTFGFGLSLALISSGTMASVSGIGVHATGVFGSWLARRAVGPAVFAFVAFSALRETLETFLLMRFIAARQSTEEVAWGIALGLLACALLAAAWEVLKEHRSAHWTFRLSAVLLFVLGMQMMLDAIAEVLVRGVAGDRPARFGYALQPYLEEGDRYWMLCLVLAVIPLLIWARRWWRRAGN